MMAFRFGLKAPTENDVLIREQMRLANRYRNVHVEIERGRRAAIREAERAVCDVPVLHAAVVAAEAEVDAAVAAISEARRASRSKSETREARKALAAAKAKRAAAAAAFRAARATARSDAGVLAEMERINALAGDLARNARAHCGLYWGTYLLVEAEAQQSRGMPLFDGAEPNDPRFAQWDGEARLGIQIQGGVDAARIVGGTDQRLRIDSVDPGAWHAERRGDRRRLARTTLRMRIGSDEDRGPVWGVWPMVMHRPLPEGAVVKGAQVHVRRCGPHEEWSLILSVETAPVARRATPGAVVAIDVGWRKVPGGLRVATWQDDSGGAGQLVLPEDLVSQLAYPDALQSIRDRNMNAAIKALVEGCAARGEMPEWMRRATVRRRDALPSTAQALAYLGQWRSPGRLAALALEWRRRQDGDELFAALEAWRVQDKHLWTWQEAQRQRSLRHRREVYRVFAAGLVRRYGTIVLEKFDLRSTQRRKATGEDAAHENESARQQQKLAAISELRAAIGTAARSSGATVATVDAAWSTRTCADCGHANAFDAAAMIHFACASCGVVWDQDENAAANLLARWREQPSAAELLGGARDADPPAKRESRWAKAKRLAAERRALEEGAREACAKAAG